MKKGLLLLLLVSLFACNDGASTSESTETALVETDENTPAGTVAAPVVTLPEETFLGFYVGLFEAVDYKEPRYQYANKINISLDSMVGGKLFGHSVVAGNDRPFQGTYQLRDSQLSAEVAEPGDDRYDGTFTFSVDRSTKRMTGTWKAYNEKLPVPTRKYELEPRTFKYDPKAALPEMIEWAELYDIYDDYAKEGEFLTEDVTKFNASAQKLTKADVENMYKGDLEIIRNAIYARHGYSFKNRKVRFIFDRHVDWYMPVSTDIRAQLTALERENIDLLKRYEEHAERYYDVFGR